MHKQNPKLLISRTTNITKMRLTVFLIIKVYGEGYAVKAVVADAAPEAARVVGLPHGLKTRKR